MMKRIFFCAALLLTAVACSVYKDYSRPALPELDGLYGSEVTGLAVTDSASLADLGWRDFFTDPLLQELITRALDQNPGLQIASQRVIEAEASLQAARLALLPTLGISSSVSFGESEVRYGGSALGYGLSPSASWEVDLRGSLTHAKRKALAAYERSGVYHRSVRTELIAAVARAYYTLQMLDGKLAISRQTADSWKENVRIMKAMKEAGMTNEASVSQTEANALSIEASLYDLEFQVRQVENSLCLLMGETPHPVARSEFDLSGFPSELLTGVPSQLLARRPDVLMAEQDLRMAFYDTQIARSAFYPALRLTGAYGWEKALTSPAGLLLSLGASLSEPLLDGGRRRADLTIAKARQEEAAIAFHNCLLGAGTEVNDAVAKCLAAQGKTDLRIQQIADLRSAVSSTQQLMHNSGATYLEVLTAQQSLLSAELQQVGDRYDFIDGLISLYRALGGGE